jgi:proteic killer suppression protein
MAEPFRWLGLSRHELQFENELSDKALRVMLYVTHNSLGVFALIVSYKDKRTRNFASGNRVKAFSAVEHAARMKLDRLEAAADLRDLAALPGNRFEALKGDRKGQYSIRINDQWRICFEWEAGASGPSKVEIVDYH